MTSNKAANPVGDEQDPWAGLRPGIAPPQANGELIFEAPWQGRAFGMAHSLVNAGRFSWDEFREQLIAALDGGAVSNELYYERFLLALERTLASKDAAASTSPNQAFQQALEQRTSEYEARPHGHDHSHKHH